jgi:hypothetical protein
MQTITDEMGNEIVVVSKDKKAPKKKSKGSGEGRINDNQIAAQVIEQWGKPLAYQAGQFWSYSPEAGWVVCTNQLVNLANELRGQNTENSVMKIISSKTALPDLEHCENQTTYWEWLENQWHPFRVTANQVLFANGVLEINGGELEFTPTNHRIIYGPRISIPYSDELFDEHCQEFESLIENALSEAEERTYLQRVCGLILQPHTILRGQIVFWGVPHSGKTTLATAIATAPAGVRGQSSVSEERLIADKWASTMLVNKFASVSNDSEFTPKWEAFMKQYTSGSFTVEAKFSKPTTVPTTAKLISTCNDMQSIRDVSGAAAMRYRIFQFKNQIAESNSTNQTERMVASYWANPERRKGIVAWMLNGLIDALQFGIVEPESMKQTKRKAMAASNPIIEFVEEGIERSAGMFLKASDVNDAMGIDRRHPQARQLHQTIERVWKTAKIKRKIDGESVWGYPDLKLS